MSQDLPLASPIDAATLPGMSSVRISIIIPQYNGLRFLPRLLTSLRDQSEQAFEIIMVDDGSTDGSVDWIKQHAPEVRLLRNERNLGFAGSVNAGIRASTAPFVVLLNNDTHVDSHWLAEALASFDADDIGSVASLSLLAEPPHRIDTAGDLYTVAGGGVKRHGGEPVETAATLPREVFSASGVSAFFRRSALDESGLLDESFESYYEDIDLGFRLQWRGWRCVLAPKSIVYHHLSSSYSPRGWRYRFNSSRNAEVVWWSHLSPRLRWRYMLVHLFCIALQGLAETRRGHLRPWLSGKIAAMRRSRLIRAKRADDVRGARLNDAQMLERLSRAWFDIHVSSKIRRRLPWLKNR